MSRHHKSIDIIAKAISKGSKGKWAIITDGLKDTNIHMPNNIGSRIPDWIIPKYNSMSEQARETFRPDILYLEKIETEPKTRREIETAKHKAILHIMEVGYA